MKEHINLLGLRAEDKVTGFKGVIVSISFDLYGCVQALVNPGMDDKNQLQNATWFDVPRLKITSKKSVMPVPDFDNERIMDGRKGAADKPIK